MTKPDPDKTYRNKEWLIEQCIHNRRSVDQIAKECGVSRRTIYSAKHKHNIERSGRMKNLAGQRFGRLVAISPEKERKDGRVFWLCKCDCGNTASIASHALCSGHTRSCGCLNKERSTERIVRVTENNTIDMVGKRFGRWRVVERYEKEKSNGAYWLCQCDCGNIKPVSGNMLRSGGSKSCGCLQKEIVAKISSARKRDKSPLWRCDKTDKERFENRNYLEYREWRKAVFERDDYVCQKCGERGGTLNAHHIESYNSNKDLRTALDNGVTLCKKHHNDFHHIYGRGNNTREQVEEFMLMED